MPNMLDYLAWRGDLSLKQDPFNDVDNIVLSMFSYTLFKNLGPPPGTSGMTVSDLCALFFSAHDEKKLRREKTLMKDAPFVMQAMAGTRRFGNALIKNFVTTIDKEKNMQFSSMEIILDDNTSYIAYRGTDDTLVGWKEDFALGTGTIPSETAALKYLNKVGATSQRPLRIGGHSKGGTLAVYAATLCDRHIQERIETIYDNDGPGFPAEFFDTDEFRAVQDRIRRIIPESSIVGTILEHATTPIIIKSSDKGMMQHIPMSWQIVGRDFAKGQKLSTMATILDDSIDFWMKNLDEDEKSALISDIFTLLDAPGVETLADLRKGGVHGIRNVRSILRGIDGLEENTKRELNELLKTIVHTAMRNMRKSK